MVRRWEKAEHLGEKADRRTSDKAEGGRITIPDQIPYGLKI
jgi:hypothetical protein